MFPSICCCCGGDMSWMEPANPNVCLVCVPAVLENVDPDLESAGDSGETAVVAAGVAARHGEAVGAY